MNSSHDQYLPPPIPAYEEKRLEDLYSLNILDTASEEKFDQYTNLIAELLDIPCALFTLIDRDRQWFKSEHGINLSETPREVSFCGHTILQDDVFIVPDTLKDERFAGNPLVTGDPNIRFYAGVVIRGPSGQPIGTCCVLDRKPRQLTSRERSQLIKISKLIEQELRTSYELKQLHDRLQKTALFDPLSNLPNRTLFLDRLNFLVEDYENTGEHILLVLIRLDQFARLEGMLGSQGASRVIGQFRQGLVQATGPNSFVGRWQDDILSLMVPLNTPELGSLKIVDGIVQHFSSPVDVAGSPQQVIASLGVCLFPDTATNNSELVENAFDALRSIPVHEGVRYCFFTSELESKVVREFEIEQGLRQAIKNDELHLVFQPKVNLTSGEIVGSEALLRWTSASLGRVSPAEFIPVAEESGLTVDLGYWVLKKACEQNWIWVNKGLNPIPISVNITSRQLREPGFHDKIAEILRNTGLPAYLLKLEVTEGSLIDDIESAIQIMDDLKSLGVTFSIDDFGTGFSSLGYLEKMPLDELKIDKSFVDKLTVKQKSASIVQGLIMLAHSLDLKVVSEGVENQEQLIFLRAYQCDEIQGYLFSPPVLSDDFSEMVRQNRKL